MKDTDIKINMFHTYHIDERRDQERKDIRRTHRKRQKEVKGMSLITNKSENY